MIYFIECVGRIKIGFTRSAVERRMSEIATSAPDRLKLIGTIPGTITEEKALHVKLARYCTNGEWFVDCTEVRKAISALLSDTPGARIVHALPASKLESDEEVDECSVIEQVNYYARRIQALVNCPLMEALERAHEIERSSGMKRHSLFLQIVDPKKFYVAYKVVDECCKEIIPIINRTMLAMLQGKYADGMEEAAKSLAERSEAAVRSLEIISPKVRGEMKAFMGAAA